MRLLLTVSACALVMGCEAMGERIDASRQDRCQRADWAQVGERDGVEGANMGDRYAHICGDLFQSAPYQEGLRKGAARRPRPPV